MKKTFNQLCVIVLAAAALVLGCQNPAGGDGGEKTQSPVTDALVAHFNSTTIDVVIGTSYMNFPGWGWFAMGTAPFSDGLGLSPFMVDGSTVTPGLSVLDGLVSGLQFTPNLLYTPNEGETPPYFTYKLTVSDPVTFDPVPFSDANAKRIAAAIKNHLGGIQNGAGFVADGYYFGGPVTGSVLSYPDEGVLSVTIALVKDEVAPGIISVLNITGVTIDAAGVTIDSPYSAAYNSGAKTLSVTIPAAGISKGGASAVAEAVTAALNGKITNNVDTGYTVTGTATGAINGSNVVVTVPLGLRQVPAAVIANAVHASADGNLSITAGSVTGAAITALGNISDATGNVTTAYNSASHTVTVTVSPAAAWSFSGTAGFYNIVADGQNAGQWGNPPAIDGLKRKFNAGTISNAVDPAYTSLEDVTYTVAGGNLVFTVTLSNYIKAAVITGGLNSVANASGITVASPASVTGNVITALGSVTGIASVQTAYTSASHMVLISITPATGYQFNPGLINGANPYDTVKTTLQAKIGGTAVNNVDTAYTSISPAVAIDVVEGKLRVSIILEALDPVAASDLVTAINGAADGNIVVEFGMPTSTATGTVITALSSVANATGTVSAPVRLNASYQPEFIDITISPASSYGFFAAGGYDSVATALQTKISGGSITYLYGGPFASSGVSASVNGDGKLVLTVALGPVTP
jgi:hypothetical protein